MVSLTDLLFYGVVGLFFAGIGIFFGVTAHGGAKVLFILGVIVAIIFKYTIFKEESSGSLLATGFCFIAGVSIVVYAWPFVTGKNVAELPVVPSTSGSESSSNYDVNPPSKTATPAEYYTRSYHWTYNHHSPTYTIRIPTSLYEYYQSQPHDRSYSKYALSSNDRKVLESIILDFRENSDSKSEAAHHVVAFVQSLPYFTDQLSTGYDEYPRYPIETLVDNGGDCEDTAILTAALLKEMNYDVVLIAPPRHMAVGITCSGCTGTSYTYEGKKYYYLETTGNNWKVGQLPPEYQNVKVKIYSM